MFFPPDPPAIFMIVLFSIFLFPPPPLEIVEFEGVTVTARVIRAKIFIIFIRVSYLCLNYLNFEL